MYIFIVAIHQNVNLEFLLGEYGLDLLLEDGHGLLLVGALTLHYPTRVRTYKQ